MLVTDRLSIMSLVPVVLSQVDGGSAKQSRSSYDMRPVTAGVATMEMEKSPLRHADDSNDRTPQNRSCMVKCLASVGGCLCLPCSALRRWMILYREVPHEKMGDEMQRM